MSVCERHFQDTGEIVSKARGMCVCVRERDTHTHTHFQGTGEIVSKARGVCVCVCVMIH